MRIAMFDPYNGKFTQDMCDWWTANGHEVQRQTYYNPELVLWADVVWFDTCDNNLLSATNPDQALKDEWKFSNRPGAWDMHEMDLTDKKIIVRPIDIEVWSGHHAHENMWELVDDCIFIAPHIRDIMMADSRPQASDMKIHVIPHSVNLDRWTFKEREPGFNIAVVSELWESKGTDIVPQIAIKLKAIDPRYQIHWLGKWSEYHWDKEWFIDFVAHNELPITITEWVDDLDAWLEDKNYLLHCSKKEAFSAATAEVMAKGIKPVLHRFFGADALWPDMTWNSIDEAVEMITEKNYHSEAYPAYLKNHGYTTPQMMNKIMEVING